MSTIYNLRCKMISFVHAGLIERAEYDSLFEVLCETKCLLPQHTDDVERAVQLIDKLLPVPSTGGRVYVVGAPDTVDLALAHVAHVQEQLHMSGPPVEFVGVSVRDTRTRTRCKVGDMHLPGKVGDMHLPVSPEYLARSCSFISLDSIIRDNVPLLVRPKVDIVSRKTLKTPQPVPFRGYMNGKQVRE